MRRGWILTLIFVVLVAGGGFVWWWSTPGQLWWLRHKIQNGIPVKNEVPWSGDGLAMIELMEPQWSRLIDRGFVSWYCRRLPGEWSRDQIRHFYARVKRELRRPAPYDVVGGTSVAGDRSYTTIEYLLPADQHATLDAILHEVIGNTGEVIKPSGQPTFWFNSENAP